MNQLVEKFLVEKIGKFSLAQSYCEHVGNFIRSMSSKYGVELDASTAILCGIIGCLCIWIHYISKRRPRTRPRKNQIKPISPDQVRCYWLGEVHGGDLVLQRLEQFNAARVNPATLDNTEKLLKALLQEEHLDLMKLQNTVTKLEMSGSEDSAVKILEDAAKKARNEKKQHEAYEIEMLLVEMLIYKEDLDKALKCDCLEHELIKDKRRPLYKAIIYKMQKDTEKANQWWDEFDEVRDPCLNGASHQTDFREFKKSVERLQSAIKEFAMRKKSTPQ